MRTTISIDTNDLKRMIIAKLADELPRQSVDPSMVQILVKSKQNYKAEWEAAEFKAEITINTQEAK